MFTLKLLHIDANNKDKEGKRNTHEGSLGQSLPLNPAIDYELNQSVVWNYQIHLLALRALTGCILHNVDLVRWLLQQKCHQEYQELIEDNKQTLLDSFLSNSVLLPSIDFSNYSLNEIIASLNSVVNHLQWEDHYGKPSLSYIVDTSEMKDQKSQLVYTIGVSIDLIKFITCLWNQ
ncbi:uncharacterized protein LOC113468039 [Diaphorina citri]|uniref:Uncharacterized protein LOC113468039 n=1 Tax=Diaphorina citri TaxID=121845 RepID=A0A3Q0J0I6_DIACI|nr:uncharacterized protein LOC113468039 [Diaphorina citri]